MKDDVISRNQIDKSISVDINHASLPNISLLSNNLLDGRVHFKLH